MVLQMEGVVRGRRIELERETGLPVGSKVVVKIEPRPLTLAEKQQLVDTPSGVWKEDASIEAIFTGIERQRTAPNTLSMWLD